ncbi:sulfotransferase 1B1-like [Chironomus tepperi]|uniref:sulfotransferase 1B1-like n=1 Tax=Chironomus tepperi TaxID=113505 RepID=UPI00391FBDD8
MYKIEVPKEEIVKRIETNLMTDFVKISAEDDPSQFCIMPRKFVDQDLERVKNMEIYEDDIWVVTYPKCGTTWAMEMIWMINNNLDYETSMTVNLEDRFPFMELSGIATGFPTDTFEYCKNKPRPRYIKSHLPVFLLPDQLWTVKPKIIYVTRNPKDTAVSWYHHHKHMHGYQGSKEDYIQAFVKDLMMYSPMNEHITEFWKIRNEPNILFLFFEDMKRNLDQEVKKTMKFLDKDYSQDEIDKLCKHLSFESIKDNKMVNKEVEIQKLMEASGRDPASKEFSFVRKGQVGGYKKELSAEENEMLDEYVNCSGLEKAEFEYKF